MPFFLFLFYFIYFYSISSLISILFITSRTSYEYVYSHISILISLVLTYFFWYFYLSILNVNGFCLLQREYKDLAEGLSEYVVRLLSRVRTQEELEIVLNKAGNPRDNKYESLARFKLAIRYNEKKVGISLYFCILIMSIIIPFLYFTFYACLLMWHIRVARFS